MVYPEFSMPTRIRCEYMPFFFNTIVLIVSGLTATVAGIGWLNFNCYIYRLENIAQRSADQRSSRQF